MVFGFIFYYKQSDNIYFISINGKRIVIFKKKGFILLDDFVFYRINFQDILIGKVEIVVEGMQCFKIFRMK